MASAAPRWRSHHGGARSRTAARPHRYTAMTPILTLLVCLPFALAQRPDGVPPPGLIEKPWRDCPGGIDFTHPDFALTVRMTDAHAGPSRFYYSTDRGHTWEGPFRLPLFGQKGIAARTDYLVNGKHDCTLFLTAAKPNGREGRPLCVRTTDGGRSWQFVGWIGEEPKGYAIMPSTVRLGPAEVLTAVRRRDDPKAWIETYRSRDDGKTWKLDTVPAPDLGTGNPASLIR